MEIWKDIEGYEGLYQVSTHGRVRSLGNGKYNNSKVRLLKPSINTWGYLQVCLCKNGKTKKYLVHRLVAEAFLPNWFDDPQVNHIDEDKTNNHIDNLEWCDCKYNINYGTHNERMTESKSKPILQLTKTGKLIREWTSIREAGRNNFNPGHIVSCCNGKLKHHKGYIWKYKEVV